MRIGVIGGGVNGAAIAYFLKKFGAEEVLLFEKGNLGGVSTSKSIGIIRHHYANKRHIQIVNRSRNIIEQLDDYIGKTGDFHQNGYLGVAGEENKESFHNTVQTQQDLGLDVELLSPEELVEYLPAINPEGIAIGAFERDAGFADPYQISMGFAHQAQNMGANILSKTEVLDIRMDKDGRIQSVETDAGEYDLDYLVNCGGPYAGEVAQMVGIHIPQEWFEVKVAVLSSSLSYSPDLPTMSDMDTAFYTKPESGGDFIASGFSDSRIDNLGDGYEGVSSSDLEKLIRLLEYRLPDYADAKLVNTWSGTITASPDWYQIIGVPEGLDNFYNMVNGSGHGFKEAPAFAESISKEILGMKPDFDLSQYRLERFEQDDLIQGGYQSAGWFG